MGRGAGYRLAAALATTAALLLASGGLARAAEDAADERSQIAPLAQKSLLLGAARAGERVVVVGERGHILLSDDRGASWRQVVAPTRSTLTAVHFPSPQRGFAVGHDAVVLRSTDGGETWERRYWDPELESPLLGVWMANDEHGFAVGAYGLFLETTDGGDTWSSRMISDRDVHHNVIAATEDGRLFILGEMGSVFRSDDAGQTWTEIESPDRGSHFGAFGLPGGGLRAFGLQGRVYRTNDGGETWQRLPTDTEASLMGGTLTEDGRIVLGGITGVVLVGTESSDSLELVQRPDRKAVSSAAALPGKGVLLLGAFGVSDSSAMLAAPGPVGDEATARLAVVGR
jgi:photosystem II stability/assembly factor-like uncharacterized protein